MTVVSADSEIILDVFSCLLNLEKRGEGPLRGVIVEQSNNTFADPFDFEHGCC